jgi:hypothetical protein
MANFRNLDIQAQYDAMHSYFKTSTESYDEIEWNGEVCSVILNNETIESYKMSDLKRIIGN